MLVILLVLSCLVLPVAHTARAAPYADFNGDGFFDAMDADLLTAESGAGTNDPTFDLNGDGFVNASDLDDWLSLYSADSGVPLAIARVDVNFDWTNTVADFQIIESNLLVLTTNFTDGNLNADNLVDAADRELYIRRGGIVPEPSTFLLVAFGTLGLFGYARLRGR